jgi:hypothetical protein
MDPDRENHPFCCGFHCLSRADSAKVDNNARLYRSPSAAVFHQKLLRTSRKCATVRG